MKPSDIIHHEAVECCVELFGRETFTDDQLQTVEIHMLRAIIDSTGPIIEEDGE